MVIMSQKRYNEIVNKVTDEMYAFGYKRGYEDGKREAILSKTTPNELRALLGLPPLTFTEVKNNV